MAEIRIGSETFKCDPLPAGEAIELLAELMRVVGPAVGRLPALIVSLNEEGPHASVMTDVAALAALADILKETKPSALRELVARIASLAMVQRPSGYDKCILDLDFHDNLKGVIPVVRFILEVQFRDFFTGSAGNGIFGGLRAAFLSTR